MWCESFSLVELSSRLSYDMKPWLSWTRSSASTKSFTSSSSSLFRCVVLERWRLFFSSLSSMRWHTRELSRLAQETLVHDAEIKMNIVVIFMRIVLETFSLSLVFLPLTSKGMLQMTRRILLSYSLPHKNKRERRLMGKYEKLPRELEWKT